MFNRFSRTARLTVLGAVREAENARAPKVTQRHLMLALVGQEGTVSSALLAEAGVTKELVTDAYRAAERKGGLSAAEAASLRELGIDVEQVVARVEEALGENALAEARRDRRRHLPFATEAKAILVRALREGQIQRDRELGDVHLLLALSACGGVAAELLDARGLTYLDLRGKLSRAS